LTASYGKNSVEAIHDLRSFGRISMNGRRSANAVKGIGPATRRASTADGTVKPLRPAELLYRIIAKFPHLALNGGLGIE
jgi:hypothetical protein